MAVKGLGKTHTHLTYGIAILWNVKAIIGKRAMVEEDAFISAADAPTVTVMTTTEGFVAKGRKIGAVRKVSKNVFDTF